MEISQKLIERLIWTLIIVVGILVACGYVFDIADIKMNEVGVVHKFIGGVQDETLPDGFHLIFLGKLHVIDVGQSKLTFADEKGIKTQDVKEDAAEDAKRTAAMEQVMVEQETAKADASKIEVVLQAEADNEKRILEAEATKKENTLRGEGDKLQKIAEADGERALGLAKAKVEEAMKKAKYDGEAGKRRAEVAAATLFS